MQMQWIDVILLILIAAALSAAAVKCLRDKKRGRHSCGGDCASCGQCTGRRS